MSASEISSELCSMEQCGEEQSEGLSSDIGGFLSGSCMETDEKTDPFNSETALGFPEDSSRFDSDCILSSSLVEGVSMQQTTTCDSSVPSFVFGDCVTSSVLSGGSFLLCDLPTSAVEKTTNPVMQMTSSNIVLLSGTDMKGTEHKLDVLSPAVQLLTPPVPLSQSHSQSQPVVIGNSNAASFVKSVFKEATVLPTTSPSTLTGAKETVGIPPVMFLNSAFLPSHNMLQSAPGISPSPLLIQLPSGFGVTNNECVQQLISNVITPISQCSTSADTCSGAVSTDISPGVNINSLSPECTVNTSCDGLNPGTVSCPTQSSVPPVLYSTPGSSSSVQYATSANTHTCECSVSVCNDSISSNANTNSVISSINSCESSAPQVSENQIAKVPHHPIVISCMKPDDKGGKGMKQILEHFVQQSKANLSMEAINTDNSQPLNMSLSTNIAYSGTASTSDSGYIRPQVVSASDFEFGCSSPLFSVPSLGRKSSSVVFILKRTDLQATKVSSEDTPGCSTGDKTTMAMNVPLNSNTKEDEIDGGSVSCSVSSSIETAVSGLSDSTVSEVSVTQSPCCSGESSTDQQSAVSAINTEMTDNKAQYQWVQIQVPANLAEERRGTADDVSEDIQKLIPLTVNEKLTSDVCRPIIICIVQEDGLMKKVNVNPMEANQEGVAEGSVSQDSVHKLCSSGNPEPKSVPTDTLDITADSMQPQPTPSGNALSSEPVTPSPSQSSAESSSAQTGSGSDSGSPPARFEASLKLAKDKQYKCDLCTAVFSRLGNYTRHRKIHTLNLKEDIHFKCPYCERPFLQRCDMNRHTAIHTNQYPFRCQTCNKGYIRKSDLVVHERFHSKNRAFKCETCGRAFYQSGDLSRHKRFVHMEQSQLSCGHCHRKYASEVTLIRHIKTAHNDILLQSAAQHSQQQ